MNRTPEHTNKLSDPDTAPQDENHAEDALTVLDRSGRRQFIRRGAAFVTAGGVAGSLLTTSGNAYADDCDRNAGAEKNAQIPNSDSDSGASADPAGCGREPEKPKISQQLNPVAPGDRSPVGKIKV